MKKLFALFILVALFAASGCDKIERKFPQNNDRTPIECDPSDGCTDGFS